MEKKVQLAKRDIADPAIAHGVPRYFKKIFISIKFNPTSIIPVIRISFIYNFSLPFVINTDEKILYIDTNKIKGLKKYNAKEAVK